MQLGQGNAPSISQIELLLSQFPKLREIRYKLLNAAIWLFSSCHLIYRKLTPPLYPPYFNIILPVTKQENYRNHENEKRTTAFSTC